MKAILIGAALAAATLPASAYEIREYTMRADTAQIRPGLEYVVVGRDGRKVRVIEGQPRWNTQSFTTVRDRREMFEAPSYPFRDVVE